LSKKQKPEKKEQQAFLKKQ